MPLLIFFGEMGPRHFEQISLVKLCVHCFFFKTCLLSVLTPSLSATVSTRWSTEELSVCCAFISVWPCLISLFSSKMFYLEDNSEDEKAQESSLSKTAGVYRDKAPPGILVSSIHPCLRCLAWSWIWVVLRRTAPTKWKWWVLLVWKTCCCGHVLSLKCSGAQSAWLPALPLSFMLSLFCLLVFSNFLPREECGCFKLRTRLQLDFKEYWALFLHLSVVVRNLSFMAFCCPGQISCRLSYYLKLAFWVCDTKEWL